MAEKENVNILKIRDDSEHCELEYSTEKKVFSYYGDSPKPSWLTTSDNLRGGIEPWLTSLFQSEHLSLLAGTGLSTAVQVIATKKCSNVMSEPKQNNKYKENIKKKAEDIAQKSSRGKANIEDYIRVINELLRGLEVLGHDSATDETKVEYDNLSKNLENIIKDFVDNISDIERDIALAEEKRR